MQTERGAAQEKDALSERAQRSRALLAFRRTLLYWYLLIFAVLPITVEAQISPGPLSHAHRELEGPGNCTQCHAIKPRTPDFRCLDCHKEIAARLQRRSGLHSTFVPKDAPSNACVKCHSDHNGEAFSLVRWDTKRLDHSKTGYTLEGKHATLECNRCHNKEKITPSARAEIQIRDFNRSYLGLGQTCISCHEDKHHGQLGLHCERCHNSDGWKQGKSFDHSKTKYPLTGEHLNVSCQKCHALGADGTPRYVGLKFNRCADCHSDPHRSAFKQSCEECHSTGTWRKSAAAKFDHSATKYPLEGKHAQVGCETCHHGSDFKKAIVFSSCSDCHKPDPHTGQFSKRADRGACESCHTVDGFKPSKFALVEHNKSAFPLREKHADLECGKCHTPAGKATLYKVKFALCTDCHKDAHQGQFKQPPYSNRCEQCHNEISFHRSSMTLARHQKIDFKLTGGHIAVACIDCHKPVEHGLVLYHFEDLSCGTCHNDPHRGQFAKRMTDGKGGSQMTGCTVCHSTRSWKDLAAFDHSSTSFELTGAHRSVACGDCHRPPNMELTLKNVDYRQAPTKCQDCHEDIHGSQFAQTRSGVTRCSDCHGVTKWRPSTFDHEKTIFSLKAAHADVRCKSCHLSVQTVHGKPVLIYKPTPSACGACHGSTLRAEQTRNVRTEGESSR